MIKIRSTQKLATSNSNGLCDVLRVMSNFKFDLSKGVVTTIVTDSLFQENIVPVQDGEDIIERKIIETRKGVAFNYSISQIDQFYQLIGTPITKEIGFSDGLIKNLTDVMIAETSQFQRQTMTNWVEDTNHVLVDKFTA